MEGGIAMELFSKIELIGEGGRSMPFSSREEKASAKIFVERIFPK
jgi:hypothetical protein